MKQVREKKLLIEKHPRETEFLVGNSTIENDGYLLTNFINHNVLVRVMSFTAAETVDAHDRVKPILRDFNPDIFPIHVGTNYLLLRKNSYKIFNDI